MAFNKSALTSNPIFEGEKVTNDMVVNKTIKDFCVCTKDDEKFITIRTTDNKHFFASSTLARLLNDNIANAFIDEYGNYSFNDVSIVVTFNGLKRAKSGRMYNDWKIDVKDEKYF